MSDMSKKIFNFIFYLVIFVLCMYLLISGQKSINAMGLMKMIIGLLGVLGLLYLYNRNYK